MAGKEEIIGGAVDDEFGDAGDDFFSGGKKSPAKSAPKPEQKTTPAAAKPTAPAAPTTIVKPASIPKTAEKPAAAEPKAAAKPPVETKPAAKPPAAPTKTEEAPAATKPQKPVEKPLSDKEKAVAEMLKKAGLEKAPELTHLMRGKKGEQVPIKDIAVFIGTPDGVLGELAKELKVRNRVNLSAEVDMTRVISLGTQVMKAGRMYQPIQVAKVDDGRLECTSGRHRLVFLALVYGTEASIPVYVEDMTMCEARDAVVVANQARRALAMEKAEHVAIQSMGGDVDADHDLLYAKVCTNKFNARKYCVFVTIDRSRPVKLHFGVAASAKLQGALTTISNVEGFWGAALEWHKGVTRKDFDSKLKDSTIFLNSLVEKLQADKSFEPRQHMAAMPLAAIGKYYRTLVDASIDVDDACISEIAKVIVAMGEIGRQKSEDTYDGIVKAMKAKTK